MDIDDTNSVVLSQNLNIKDTQTDEILYQRSIKRYEQFHHKDIFNALFCALSKKRKSYLVTKLVIFSITSLVFQGIAVFGVGFNGMYIGLQDKVIEMQTTKFCCEPVPEYQKNFCNNVAILQYANEHKWLVGLLGTVAVLVFSAKQLKTMHSYHLQVEILRHVKTHGIDYPHILRILPCMCQLLTIILIFIGGVVSFIQLHTVANVLEGWIVLFIIQEIPHILFEVTTFLFHGSEDDIKFKVECAKRMEGLRWYWRSLIFFPIFCIMVVFYWYFLYYPLNYDIDLILPCPGNVMGNANETRSEQDFI